MDKYKAKIKKLRKITLSLLCIGFLGALASGCIVMAVYGDDSPSVGSIIVIALFIVLMWSSLFFLIPLRKTIATFNNIIVNEFGTSESKNKKYELYYNGVELVKYNVTTISANYFKTLWHRTRIAKMVFSPLAFSTKGLTSFQWADIEQIIIEDKQIRISLNYKKIILLPLKKNIFYLIKTFYPNEIANENQVKFK